MLARLSIDPRNILGIDFSPGYVQNRTLTSAPILIIRSLGTSLVIDTGVPLGKCYFVHAHSKSGNIINISAITADKMGYNILSISPFGEVNSVVGMKMLDATEEAVINGVSIYAHVKAIKQN